MRILTRQVDEGVVIDDDIEVTVLEIGADFVRLAVSEPGSEQPYREHLLFLEKDPAENASPFQKRPRF